MLDLNNKSVAIIGNANSLLSQNYADDIDRHDIVCRINRGVPLYTEQGTKFNILFYSNDNLIADLKNHIPDTVCKIHTNMIDPEFTKILKKKLELKTKKEKPSTGLLVISYIISLNPKQISLFGFDWKKTKTFYEETFYNKSNIDWKSHSFEKEKQLILHEYNDKHNFKIFE
jgi:hypothetical protein